MVYSFWLILKFYHIEQKFSRLRIDLFCPSWYNDKNYQERDGIGVDHRKIQTLHRVIAWILAAALLICGILTLMQIISIYQSGDRAFTRQSIGQAVKALALPYCIMLAVLIFSALISVLLPLPNEKRKNCRDNRTLLQSYRNAAPQLNEAFLLKKKQRILRIVFVVVLAVLAVYPLSYFTNTSYFGVEDINADVLSSVFVLTPFLMLAFWCTWLYRLMEDRLITKEIELYKEAQIKPLRVEKPQNMKKTWIIRGILAVVGIGFIVAGVLNEGHLDVLGKAIKICTECIGLG